MNRDSLPYFVGKIYIILDKIVCDEFCLDLVDIADKLAFYGGDIFQLRAKTISDADFFALAVSVRKVIHRRRKTFIVNDRPDIAVAAAADGVHLGKDDLPVPKVRKLLGRGGIIGKTVHSLEEMRWFTREDVDYLSVGAVFATKTKPGVASLDFEILSQIMAMSTKPVYVIGGVTVKNIHLLAGRGIRNIALCRGVIGNESPRDTITEIKQWLQKQY